ncbi:GntR family transcriptional regulator/MocR family aminotransferase [Variovorax sp. TBS-050B]|uniref:MocR-like pyridoxine biosynthesis transcription factor PdxR n=1 Tax=Variovorax sp. TBS-050B TaxID=2940551 RepID=UPI00247479AB|nr:PLP-dependent aminotransferase family protein [Variovorax sp. TBS-050B]MDH6590377.1 GntR family transcriptional regulator/MocR family aminotransferase [Variovorax sp. TBS-050B]
MPDHLQISIRRNAREPITQQISDGLRAAIEQGRLAAGARLPSWRDLASQLGVARGTVRLAYERLCDEQLIVSSGAAGTHVARRPPVAPRAEASIRLDDEIGGHPRPAGVFQMGVPAQDMFPAKTWSRMLAAAARRVTQAPQQYPDPRGEPALRAQIAAYLSLARGLACTPAQVFVTTGYGASLSLAVRALRLAGGAAWMEDPGYPVARRALALLGMAPVAVPVDAEGLDVAEGIARAPRASLAVVTAGQQAPLGVTLSPRRRQALLEWAERSQAWIVEDDYLSELQLQGRAALSLCAAQQPAGHAPGRARVLHIGSFSKTLSPVLRLGFLVVPPEQAEHFGRHAGATGAAPSPLVQHAVADFMQDGHYLRHLRRMRRLYAARRDALVAGLDAMAATHHAAGLAVLLRLPPGCSDLALARAAHEEGMAPVPLSPWYAAPTSAQSGLLLGVTNLREEIAHETCAKLLRLIARHR